MAGLFKKIGRTRRIPEKLAQYDDEYLLYCVEKDRVETVLESTLHETDDPKEIIDVTLKWYVSSMAVTGPASWISIWIPACGDRSAGSEREVQPTEHAN